MAEDYGIRAVDRARAGQMVQAQLAGDEEMFASAVNEAFADEHVMGAIELGGVVNVLRALTEDLAGVFRHVHGDQAEARLLPAIAHWVAESEAGS
ncbi:MAG TPA: hypothetical protein DEB55_10270 [Microbacterium sp.]|nr:hypothetical protein [Microbacterium sp.]|tara:strand:+ start:3706 stop:3990 length:285 start_codon:yes stop_codon:yes gene_type:complete